MAKKRATKKKTGRRITSPKMKSQQAKMKAAAAGWKAYKKANPRASYQAYMKKKLRE